MSQPQHVISLFTLSFSPELSKTSYLFFASCPEPDFAHGKTINWPCLCFFKVEDVGEQITPSLEPIFQRSYLDKAEEGRQVVRIGDADVDIDPNFKLYLATKLPNPHFLPEIWIKTSIVDFTVTRDGLQQQILGDVVKQEIPDTELRHTEIILRMAQEQKTLQQLVRHLCSLAKTIDQQVSQNWA